MHSRVYRLISLALALALFVLVRPRQASAQQDSVPTSAELRSEHSPRGALWRAAAAPGWGQLYNEQYYKLPVVWGGLLGIAGSALYVNHRYRVYRHAFFWVERENPNVGLTVPAHWEGDYLALIADLGLTPSEAAERQPQLSSLFQRNRDNLRRNRDLLYIGFGLFYGLTILDAYVSAHLLDFDVGEDLTLSLRPTIGTVTARIQISPH